MHIGVALDQLDSDPHGVAAHARAALEKIVRSELLGDLPKRGAVRRIPVLLERGARDHRQRRNPAERGRQILLYARREESVVGVGAQVVEGENRDSGPLVLVEGSLVHLQGFDSGLGRTLTIVEGR